MTRAEEILLKEMRYIASISNGQVKRVADAAITAAREYLATEPSGERAELIAELRERHGKRFVTSPSMFSKAADMMEADAQQAANPICPDCHAPGLMYECVYCSANSYPKGFVQQAKRVPMTRAQITEMATQDQFLLVCDGLEELTQIVRATENHHNITQADKPTDWSAA